MKTNKKAFSSVIAILLTAFLVIISAGALFLFVAEGRISRSLFDGFSAYSSAEGALEFALLKTKNHREGFEDEMVFGSHDANALKRFGGRRAPEYGYRISAYSNNFSGSVLPGAMVVIPLFFDKGTAYFTPADPAKLPFKNPEKAGSNVEKTIDFEIVSDSDFVWNLVGSETDGTTFGIAGTGGVVYPVGNRASSLVDKGIQKVTSGTEASYAEVRIVDFMNSKTDSYLVITNPSNSASLGYRIFSTNGFSKPGISISAAGKAGNVVSNLDFHDDNGRIFDALKYSIFDPGN